MDSDLLEDVVRLVLGNADTLGRGHLKSLRDQEVCHLPGSWSLKNLPVVSSEHMMTLVSPDLRERSVSVDMGLTARLYSSLHQICFLRIIMIIVTLCLILHVT